MVPLIFGNSHVEKLGARHANAHISYPEAEPHFHRTSKAAVVRERCSRAATVRSRPQHQRVAAPQLHKVMSPAPSSKLLTAEGAQNE